MPLDPSLLPTIEQLRRRTKALAMVEAIACPEWEDRYYSFNAAWSADEEMASMRTGSGDDWFLLFSNAGAGLKGLDHKSPAAGDKELLAEVRRQVSPSLATFLNESAFGWDWMSYCYWRTEADSTWNRVKHSSAAPAEAEDGSEEFLSLLLEPSTSYVEFASWYYEVQLPSHSVEAIYCHTALTPELVTSLNADADWGHVLANAKEIGYPCPSSEA